MKARIRTSRPAAAVLLLFGLAACDFQPGPVGMERGASLYNTCQPCHGDAGEGIQSIEAPAIAGLPQWYVEAQLEGFQSAFRGWDHTDLPGLRMRPMAATLNKEGDIESVAQYVASLPPVYPASTLDGNAGAGAQLYEVCVACHGVDGMGDELLRAPPIVQLQDWYLVNQLRHFRSGARGAHPNDVWGATMRVNTLALTEQAMRDVVAYVQTLR